ncbi:MAG: HNH endonuclease [Firmicutes bacterium]|nr:HNH endonuclease [Bacillota bacterium]
MGARKLRYALKDSRINASGYLEWYNPDSPFADKDGFALRYKDRSLHKNGETPAGHHIHHGDNNKLNDKYKNLVILPAGEHGREHNIPHWKTKGAKKPR